jgi:type IV secretory pathway VirB2 component (pilin)
MAPLAFSPDLLGPLVLNTGDWVRAAQTPVMPWDPTLYTILDYLTGPALHAITWIAFIAAALAYALGVEFDGGARRLFRMGIGLLLASHAVQIMNFLFG